MKRIAMVALPLLLLAGIAVAVLVLVRRRSNASESGPAEAVEHVEPEGRRSNEDADAMLGDAAALGLTHL
jgi:H+/Cl- antiporter ClcA